MSIRTQSLHIALPTKMRRYIEQQSKKQNYSTKSDFIQAIIRKNMKRMEQEKLERMLLEGLVSGEIEYNEKKWKKAKAKILAEI